MNTGKICKNCGQDFKITLDDEAFYKKIKVPHPTHCPDCRLQRRMVFRNERTFYRRTCDLCKKEIFSIYTPDSEYTIYCPACWWSDNWNAMDYGVDFDFNRPFFEQYKELHKKIPILSIINAYGENDDYCNYCYRCKNSYLLIASDDNEDSYYSTYLWDSRNCMDCLNVTKSELCYELIDSKNCFHSFFSKNLENCHDCHFCFDLKGCSNCFGCSGLRQKSYCYFNEQLTKENYEEKIRDLKFSPENIREFRNKTEIIKLKIPHKYANLINCENCTGDGLQDSKNSFNCFDSYGLEDCKFIMNGPGQIKDCYDFTGVKDIELAYEGISTGDSSVNTRFTCHTWTGLSNVTYCTFCISSSDIFGCIGLSHKQYCILNRQYSPEDYKILVEKIEKHMTERGEFGEYFPITNSPFAYNETLANEHYPLTKEQALAKGYRWKDSEKTSNNKQNPEAQKEIHTCEHCDKNYKTLKSEIKFYENYGLPIPRFCPDCRHFQRIALRNPCKLFSRSCTKCTKPIQTTYSPDRPEMIYCEECYLKEIY